jgi:hypothetical protein
VLIDPFFTEVVSIFDGISLLSELPKGLRNAVPRLSGTRDRV